MEEKPTEKKPKKNDKLIRRDMTFAQVIEKFPQAAGIMTKYGLHCIGCHVAFWETVEQGGRAHGLSEEQIDEMLDEINKAAEKSGGKSEKGND